MATLRAGTATTPAHSKNWTRCHGACTRLVDLGVTPGMRLVLLVKPGIEFVKLVFALLRSGRRRCWSIPAWGKASRELPCRGGAGGICRDQPRASGANGFATAVSAKRIECDGWPSVVLGRQRLIASFLQYGQHSAAACHKRAPTIRRRSSLLPAAPARRRACCTRIRCSTRRSRRFNANTTCSRAAWTSRAFALFGLFNSAMGVTTVFPEMDFSRPASADPRKLLAAANDWQVTQAFASPAVWDN